MNSVEAILEDDRILRRNEQRMNLWLTPILFVLLAVLLWFAVIGKTPIVRAGYALMAVGIAITVFAGRAFANWSRQSLPGPVDTRSQLHKTTFLLSQQASLARSSPIWGAPTFLGAALIGLWAHQERGPLLGYAAWVLLAMAWIAMTLGCVAKARAAEKTKARMEELLRDLG
jgi:hypothetical protein